MIVFKPAFRSRYIFFCNVFTSLLLKAAANPNTITHTARNILENQCVGNLAAEYPCMDIDLLSFLPESDMGITGSDKTLNDIWGWTDSSTNKEYALVGKADGVAFVDVSDPSSPLFVGYLESHNNLESTFRDIKTYENYAFIVANVTDHGMQIFDLTQLSSTVNTPASFEESGHFGITLAGNKEATDEGFALNIAINENTGYAYLTGSNNCQGGLYMLDISNPLSIQAVGCYVTDGYISDVQCVLYDGPDTEYTDSEICFASYIDGLSVIDVTDKINPTRLSTMELSTFVSIEQGWLTEDKNYFLMSDKDSGGDLKTYVMDITNLEELRIANTYTASIDARQGNQFVKGDYLYQATFRGGLRILDLSEVSNEVLTEVAYFDTTPDEEGAGTNGVWGVYPFLNSDNIIISSVEEGLFVLNPTFEIFPTVSPSIFQTISPSSKPVDITDLPTPSPSSLPSSQPTADVSFIVSVFRAITTAIGAFFSSIFG